MTLGVAREFAHLGIRCLSISPGPVRTPFQAAAQSSPELVQQFLAIVHREIERHAFMAIHELGQQARKEVVAGADDRHVEAASGYTLKLRHRIFRFAELLNDAAAVMQHLGTRGREIDPLAELLEQRQPDMQLELPNLCGNSGLRQMQLFRGTGKTEVTGDRLEHLQLPQRGILHCTNSCNL